MIPGQGPWFVRLKKENPEMLYIVELYYKKDGYIYEEDVFFTTRKAEAEKKYAELKAGTPGIYVIDKARLTVPKDRDAKEFFNASFDF